VLEDSPNRDDAADDARDRWTSPASSPAWLQTGGHGSHGPIRPDVVWALDFQFVQTTGGRMLKPLNVIDE